MNTTKKSTRVWIAGSLVFAVFFSFAPQAYALNQASNFNFSSSGAYWNSNNAVVWQTCGTNSTTTATAWTTFQRNSTAVTSWTGQLSGSNVQQGGYAWQTITVPGSGNQNVNGLFKWSSNISGGTASGSWVRLDIFDPSGTYRGTVGCTAFNTTTATTTVTSSTPIVLTGGTTYRISITEKGRTTSGGSGKFVNDYITNVVVSVPPVNPAASGPANSKSVSLTWDASTATTTANGLAAANGYGIYRGTSSGAETALASSTSASYTDSATVGNTTYYYWLTNTDTASFESASSSEVSLLTKPDAPSTPTFSSVTDTTLTVLWNPPTGGASTYDVERCTGAACNSGWTTVSSAQAGTSFNDSGLVKSTTYGYRIVGNNATGAGVYSATGYQQTNSFSGPAAVPTRTLRLFEGFKIKFTSGKIILRQK